MTKKKSNVPKLRFPGFTDPWEQRKAVELFIDSADKGYPKLPVLSATQDRGMVKRDDNDISIIHDKKNEEGYKRVLPGQFVIHLRSFQGGFAYSDVEGITSPAYTVFGFSDKSNQNEVFWKYIFTSKEFIKRLETVTYGIRDGRSISYKEFLGMSFVIPGKNEQIYIARFLLSLDHLITLHQRKLEHLQLKKKALLQKMFPRDGESVPELRFPGFTDAWEQRKLCELGSVITGNTPSTSDNKNWAENKDGHVWITPSDIDRFVISDSERHLSDIGWKKAHVVPQNSVLITSIASIGKNAINAVPTAFNQQINAIVPNNNDAYFILSAMVQATDRFTLLAGRTATPIINKEIFEKFTLMIPILEEQYEIGDFFKQIDHLITLHQRKLEHLQQQKKALLQQMFV